MSGFKTGNQMKKRGFPAAGRTNDAEKLTGRDLQVDVFERDQPAFGEPIGQRDIAERHLGEA